MASVEEIVERSLSARVAAIDTLAEGLRHQMFRVRLRGGRSVVFRRNHRAINKELRILRYLWGQIAVPEVLAHSRSWLILNWIPGVTFHQFKRSASGQAIGEAAEDIGRTMARLHAIRIPRWLPRSADAAATLTHGDFNNRNIIVRKNRGRWRVAALIDWEAAEPAGRLSDVATFLQYERLDAPCRQPHFSRGYVSAGGQLTDNWWHAQRLIALTRNCATLCDPHTSDSTRSEVRDLLLRYAAELAQEFLARTLPPAK